MRLWSGVVWFLDLLLDAVRFALRSQAGRRAWRAFVALTIILGFFVTVITGLRYLRGETSNGAPPSPLASATGPRTTSPSVSARQHSRPAGPKASNTRPGGSKTAKAKTSHAGVQNAAVTGQPLQDDRYEAKAPIATKASVPTPIVHSPPPSTTPEASGKGPTSTTVHESAKVKSEATGGAESSGNSSGAGAAESASNAKTPTVELNSASKAADTSTGTEADSPGRSSGASSSASGSANGEASVQVTTTH